MPHFIVEYSANLEPEVDVAALVGAIHKAVVATGVFELGGVRTRAEPRTIYAVADQAPDNAFLAVTGRIARGRDAETRTRVAQALLDVLSEQLAIVSKSRPLAISVEIQEIDPVGSLKQNNIHALIKARATESRSA